MMKIRMLMAMLMAVLLLAAFAQAETAADPVIAIVNGEQLMTSEYAVYEAQYLQAYAEAGSELDEAQSALVKDLALTAAIQDVLIRQDMKAQGCDSFEAETEAWLTEQGRAAYQNALQEVGELLRSQLGYDAAVDMTPYALSYASIIGVSEANYIEVYRSQYAYMNYCNWLLREAPVTDEEVQMAYEERVAASRARYAQDVAAFETAMYSGEEVWYRPEGYRGVLTILLPAQGDTDETRLASVETAVQDINARLAAGEPFQSLMAVYDTSGDVNDPSLMAAGYQVHRDSIIWDDAFVAAAFSEEMAKPGCWSKPVVSEYGVHILYYLCDSDSGAVAMNDEIHDALAYSIFSERSQAAMMERLQQLMDAAEVTIQ